MKVFKTLCAVLLIAAVTSQFVTSSDPSGIESGVFTLLPAVNQAPSTILITFSDASILGPPFFGIALIDISSAPKQNYRFVPTSTPTVTSTSASFTYSISNSWISLSLSWLASNGEPIVLSMFTLAPTTQGTFSVLLPSNFPLYYPNSAQVRIDTLIAGFDYSNAGSNTGLAIRIIPAPNSPPASSINPLYADVIVNVSANGQLVAPSPITSSSTTASQASLQYYLTYEPTTGTALTTLVVTVLVHTVSYKNAPMFSTIETGYAIPQITTATRTNLLFAYRNDLSVPSPKAIFGFESIEFPLTSSTLNIKMSLVSAQTSTTTSTLSTFSVDQAIYMYAKRYPCPIADLTGLAANFGSYFCTPTGVTRCNQAGTTVTLSYTGLAAQQLLSPTITTSPPGTSTYQLNFLLNIPNDNTSQQRLTITILPAGGASITYVIDQVNNFIPTGTTTERYTFLFQPNAPSFTIRFTLDSLNTASSSNPASLTISDLKLYEMAYLYRASTSQEFCFPSVPVGAASCVPSSANMQTGNSQSSSTTISVFLEPASCLPCSLGLVVTNGVCSCPNGYFPQLSAGTVNCLPCQQQFCTSCAVIPSTCSGCLYGRILDSGTGLCNCPTGRISSPSGPCITCNYACASCDSPSTCVTCQSTSGGNPTFRISTPIQGICGCQPGYYDDGVSAICKKCPLTCNACQLVNGQLSCINCVVGANTVFVNGVCQCYPAFTPNPIGDGTCVACDISCLTCRGPYTGDCLTCSTTTRVRIIPSNVADPGAGACACLSGLSETNPRSADCVVLSCASINTGCINCNLLTCTACSTVQNFKPTPNSSTGKCACQDGYYFNNATNTCITCGATCSKCNSPASCATCYLGATLLGGVCSCPAATYPDQTTSQCLTCTAIGCTICPGNVCSNCSAPRILVSDATCMCPDQTYDSNGQCISCTANCRLCNSTGCIVCTNGLSLLSGICSNCSNGFVGVNGVCATCPQNCQTCSQPTSCTICNTAFYLYMGRCLASCPRNTLTNTTSMTCFDCVAPCATCSNQTNTCTSCIIGSGNLFGGICGACPIGTAPISGGCQVCSTPCATCLGSPSQCSSCPVDMYLYQGTCQLFCPNGTFYSTIGRECQTSCADGTYPQGQNCINCSSNCAACTTTATTCIRCPAGQFLYNNNCNSTCPAGVTLPFIGINGGVCLSCPIECSTCSSPTVCTACIAPGVQPTGGRCISCQGNTVLNPTTSTCDPCPANCLVCLSATSCIQCSPQAVASNGLCVTCLSPCATCNGSPTTCASCISGFALAGTSCTSQCPYAGQSIVNSSCICTGGYFYNGQCIATCPNGTGIGQSRICVNCPMNCVACPLDSNTCIQCTVGWSLINGGCTRANNCSEGQALVNGNCIRMCAFQQFFSNGFCVSSCPAGTITNSDSSGCIVSNMTTTPCRAGEVYAFGSCFSACPSSTYKVGNVCVNCPNNCANCVNSTYCTDCITGYYFSSGTCQLSTICPTPQLSLGQGCVNSCPNGTYTTGTTCNRLCGDGLLFYNSYCYTACSSPLVSNGYACVVSCPSGQSVVNGVCTGQGSGSCSIGFYFNTAQNTCQACQSPCASCIGLANICTSCIVGTPVNGQCQINGGGGNNGGGSGNAVIANVVSSSLSGTQLEVQVQMNAYPTGLTVAQQSQFFTVVLVPTTPGVNVQVYQWIDITTSIVHVLIQFPTTPSANTLVLMSLNVAAVAQAYASMGYNDFTQSNVQTTVKNAQIIATVTSIPNGLSPTFALSPNGTAAT